MSAVEDDPPDYGGAICKDDKCGWQGNDPRVQRCPRCGGWNRFWVTSEISLIPPGGSREPLPPHWYDEEA